MSLGFDSALILCVSLPFGREQEFYLTTQLSGFADTGLLKPDVPLACTRLYMFYEMSDSRGTFVL